MEEDIGLQKEEGRLPLADSKEASLARVECYVEGDPDAPRGDDDHREN